MVIYIQFIYVSICKLYSKEKQMSRYVYNDHSGDI